MLSAVAATAALAGAMLARPQRAGKVVRLAEDGRGEAADLHDES